MAIYRNSASKIDMLEQLKKDIDEGLSKDSKSLPSKYFYDKRGDALFQQIMHLPEYYLTRSELEIFQTQSQNIIDGLNLNSDSYFELIELGAGDGLKTKELLKALEANHYNFDYFPIDISKNALDNLENNLLQELPNISFRKKQGEYFEVLESFKDTHHQKVVLFLGSNIGNLNDELAFKFIYKLGSNLSTDDKLLLGVDLIKPSSIVLPAYNDEKGVTREFNLNLLRRLNNELDANFDLDAYMHAPEYSETEGIAKSYLVSTKLQEVTIKKLNKIFRFQEGERIFTETSRKYNDTIINKIIENTDFSIHQKFMDSKAYFANYILHRS